MAPARRSSNSKYIVGAAIAFATALYGCDTDLAAAAKSMIGVVCTNLIEHGVEKMSGEFEDEVFKRCGQLKEKAMEQGLNEEKATDLYTGCLDKTGVRVTDDANEQTQNYTELCIKALNNATNGHMSQINSMVEQFVDGLNMTSQLHGLVEGHLHDTLKEIGELYNVTVPDEILNPVKGEDKDAKDETDETDAKDAKDETDETDAKDAKDEKDEKDASRLFDSSTSLTFARGFGSSAVACFLGAALAGFVGLVAMFRRGSRASTLDLEGCHESLAVEDSEQDA